jgi:hypothetical protein
LAVVLAPFPPGLFDAFSSVERSVPLADLTVMQARKPALVVKSVSRFAGLASDEEPDGNEAIPMVEPPGPRVVRSRKEAVDEQEEDGEMEALQREKPRQRPVVAPPPRKKASHVRKVEVVASTRPSFEPHSKAALKRKIKQERRNGK